MSYPSLARLAFGYAPAQIVHAAVRLGLPDALADAPMPVEKLADALHCDAATLTRLVRALVVLGVLDEGPDDQVALADLGRPLCADHPRSMRASVLLYGHPAAWQAWGALADGVRSGQAAFDQVHGMPLFDHLAQHPDLAAAFHTAMREGTGGIAAAVAGAYDFSGARTVVDVGGGNGALLAAVLTAAPHVHGILVDTAEGAAGAEATLERAASPQRWSVATGDFFAAVPGGDVMLVKGILHDWDDERCVRLLRNCRESIAPDGRLLVVEPVLPESLGAPDAAGVVLSDIAMLVYTGGRERSRTEFRTVLAASGFDLIEVTPPLGGTAIRVLISTPS
ncbi:methyltransferase [Krasilnikovia sp. MM14-A1259]|uniref:methyltransferase n=1 Tax=Krasilnikovia sp. MM14-A1259 TaxID=3373539 RepID=UPI00381C2DE6